MTIGRIPSVEGGIQPTIVDAKGDLIAAVAADSVNRLAVGSNDQVLVADSSTSTGLAWKSYAAQFVAGKNKIINGDFTIWQRGAGSFTTNGAYTADRFGMAFGGTGTAQTVTREAFTVGTAPVAGYEAQYFCRNVVTGGSGTSSLVVLQQKVEDVRTFAGQTVTVSFWAKANTGTPKIGIDCYQDFGSGGSGTGNNPGGNVTISTTWARYSTTIAIASISGKTIGTGNFLGVRLWFSSGSDYNSLNGSMGIQSATFDVWGVQVEAGSVATPFTTATGTLQGELAACQRYYEKSYASATAIGTASVSQAFNGFYTVGSNQKMVNPGIWKVQKRTSPTVTVYDDAGNSGKISTLDTGGTATNNVAIAIIDTDDTSFRALGSSNGTQAGYKWNWVASAEL